jgi:acetyltransferase-like isoleucine patch superfamily enzyme
MRRKDSPAAPTRRARRSFSKRGRSTLFLFAAWYCPTSALRAAFHRLRGVNVGRSVEIGYFVILDNLYPERIVVEDGATISARSTILAHDEAMAYTGRGPEVLAETRIGAGAFVGVHCIVLPGITIGARAVVGAGSVVTKDVPPGVVVAGVPAKVLSADPGKGDSGR